MFRDIVLRNRSYRRFDQKKRISLDMLSDIVEFARISPSAANLQTLRFWLVREYSACETVFKSLKWANYLHDWNGPLEGEKPAAYILVLAPHNCTKFTFIDAGIVCQTMLLGAVEKGLGGCMIASVDRDQVHQDLELPMHKEILMVIALGVPTEQVVIDNIELDGNIEYWRDEKDRHHVPKHNLGTLILGSS